MYTQGVGVLNSPTSSMSPLPHLFPQSIIRSIAANLEPAIVRTLEHVHLPGAHDSSSRISAFLDILFHRSPFEVLQQKTADQLEQIIRGCLEALELHRTAPSHISINFKRSDSLCGLFIALNDHPFIISSLAERLYEAKISLNCFQHPILSFHGENTALSYIEVAPLCASVCESLLPSLRDTLQALITVISDHTPMMSWINAIRYPAQNSDLATEWGMLATSEVQDFFRWIIEGSFFFIGTAEWDATRGLICGQGIWNASVECCDALSQEISQDVEQAAQGGLSFLVSKLRLRSPVHRRVPLIHILLKAADQADTWFSVVGYLTSKAWACEALDIPIIRTKLRQVLSTELTPPTSHDYKYVIEVIDNMPTDDALRMPVRDLQTTAQLALGIVSRENSRSITCIDSQKRWATTTLIMSPSRYSADLSGTIQALVESRFSAVQGSSELHLDSSKKRQLRLYISTPLPSDLHELPDLERLNKDLRQATLSWEELLAIQIQETGINITFPENYQATTSITEAANDFSLAISLHESHSLNVSLFCENPTLLNPQLSIASLVEPISLSKAVPILENLSLEVLDANSYTLLQENTEIHLLKCVVRPFDGSPIQVDLFNTSVAPGLVRIFRGTAASDPLNLLLRSGSLSIDHIRLLRCYCALLWQTYKIATKRTMWKALAYSPAVANLFIEYFKTAFNPALSLDTEARQEDCGAIESNYLRALRDVSDVTHDRILKALLVLLKHTLRTSFYQTQETIALKIQSENVEFMPYPRPMYEIFVYSSRIEGTHLRTARVSRGGIRWSERLDDYRSEVLGLVKTQKVKNVIIVPAGAKGGFIVKTPPASGETMGAHVQTCYCEYISALLSITDNLVDGIPTHPKNCVVHDSPDPYLVVAADKGTATFSDTANSIASNQFSFWLGDAFASGGSHGYDHKKYGITARGGWECVQRHARDIGVDTNAPFTVVGIGDMSGDVFGNALIVTSSMLLIGAFNHKHIFIDPHPNREASFQERCRLFALPRSQWSDFNPAIISQGGGVFDRFAKEIRLTPEMREVLAVGEDTPETVDGETLIALVLKAPVTLLWNGGIGTYVKSHTESHSDVNDGANDSVRVNADELRCKIIGEGGNLGLTQRARIQCAQRGIRINTDAIDNSGGVDLSDHEVNLKLLLNPLVASGTLPIEQRNVLLEEISPQVVESVLQHNRDQALLITISEKCSVYTLEQYRGLIREMHSLGLLDRLRDWLPDEQELDTRSSSQQGMLRPELAVCSAAIKMWLKQGLLPSELLNDANLEPYLISYFPPSIQGNYRKEILSHSLRKEIITNEIVGEIILATGISFLPALVARSDSTIPQAMKSILAADLILGTRELRARIRCLDTVQQCGAFVDTWLDLSTALRRASTWLMKTHPESTIYELVELYGDSFAALTVHAESMFATEELSRFEARVADYLSRGLSQQDAVIASLLRRVHVVLEILWCAREYKQDIKEVAAHLSEVLELLHLQPLFKYEQANRSGNKWEQELAEYSFKEIRRELSRITGNILCYRSQNAVNQSFALSQAKQIGAIHSIMSDIIDGMRTKRPFSVSVLPLIARHLRELALQSENCLPTRDENDSSQASFTGNSQQSY